MSIRGAGRGHRDIVINGEVVPRPGQGLKPDPTPATAKDSVRDRSDDAAEGLGQGIGEARIRPLRGKAEGDRAMGIV